MKIIASILIGFFTSIVVNAQVKIITAGKIEFEKKTNQHRRFDDEKEAGEEESTWVKEMKKTLPKFVNDYYVLNFNEQKSTYKLAKEMPDNKYVWGGKPSENDLFTTDFANNTQALQKDVYEKTYLVKDSIRKLTWKLVDEPREIAGYQCKKAVAKICDSVVVVAFYCEQIQVSGGPESFAGLPGMILGLAVPRLSSTWYATKVEVLEPSQQDLQPKLKGKVATWQIFEADLKKALKDWGKYGTRDLWKQML